MNINKTLALFNLDEKESAIYLAVPDGGLRQRGKSPKKPEFSGLTFQRHYSETLLKLGLLSQISRGKRRYFQAAEPEKLLEMQEERLEELQSVLPELKALQNTGGQKPKVYFLKAGRESIR